MLNPASIPFRRFGVYAGFNQPVGKEALLFVDLLGDFPAHISQVQEVISIHEDVYKRQPCFWSWTAY